MYRIALCIIVLLAAGLCSEVKAESQKVELGWAGLGEYNTMLNG